MWVPALNLSNSDRLEIEDGEMLTDKHIQAAQLLQFPHLGGFQCTLLAQTDGFHQVTEDCKYTCYTLLYMILLHMHVSLFQQSKFTTLAAHTG